MMCFLTSARSVSVETFVIVLGGNHHGIDALGLAVHVLDADLALAVRTQVVQRARAADLAQLLTQLVRQHDRQRHQLFGLVAGVAEHQALVAGAAGVHAHRDVGGLGLNRVQNAAGLGVEAHRGVGEADVGNHFAGQLGNVQNRRGGNFSSHDAETGGHQHFAGHAARRVLLQNRVQNGIRDLVRHLVRVAFGHRFRRENMSHAVRHYAVLQGGKTGLLRD